MHDGACSTTDLCDFESDSICNYEHDPTANFKWERGQGNLFNNTFPIEINDVNFIQKFISNF